MSETAVRPCIHPRCDDGTGNPYLTTQTMCDPCRAHYRRQFDWLIADYVTLKTTLAKPAASTGTFTRAKNQSFGHPAEWASDMCHDIANMLNAAEDELREAVDAGPALYVIPEPVKVVNAQRFITPRWDLFCTFPNADEFVDAIGQTHAHIRSRMGLTRFVQKLPMPCPSCDVAALVRTVGQVTCGACDRVIREEDYPMLARIAATAALDDLVDAYDARTKELA